MMDRIKSLKTWQKIGIAAGTIVLVMGGIWAIVYILVANTDSGTTNGGVANNEVRHEEVTSLAGSTETIKLSDGENLISQAGVYHVAGSASGYIHVSAGDEDKVKIILDGVSITNNSGPAIYVESNGNVQLELVGTNTINVTTNDTLKGAIHSKADLYISGDGVLNIKSSIHGIVCKDDLEIDGGVFNITAGDDGINTNDSATFTGGTFKITASGDGIHTDGYLEINDGTFDITAREGLEGTEIQIDEGDITISVSDDGINAANKSNEYSAKVTINGGNIAITMGQGDTDGIDSNGDLYINGGTITISGQSPFDYDGQAKYTGGKMIINGTETTEITNQFMNGGSPRGQGGGRQMVR